MNQHGERGLPRNRAKTNIHYNLSYLLQPYINQARWLNLHIPDHSVNNCLFCLFTGPFIAAQIQGSGQPDAGHVYLPDLELGLRTRKIVTTAHGITETRFLWRGYRLLQEEQETRGSALMFMTRMNPVARRLGWSSSWPEQRWDLLVQYRFEWCATGGDRCAWRGTLERPVLQFWRSPLSDSKGYKACSAHGDAASAVSLRWAVCWRWNGCSMFCYYPLRAVGRQQ